MWVAKQFKYEDILYLFNRLPIEVSDEENKIYFHKRHYRNFKSGHGQIYIDKKFNPMFEGLEQPIEVNLVKCKPSEVMFYIQRHKDCKGFAHLYIDRKLTTHYWLSGEKTINVDTYSGHRLPSDMFPELKEEDGYIPIKLEIVCG